MLTVSETELLVAGFYLTTFGVGTLEPGAGSREMGGELVHQRPYQGAAGVVEIPFTWTAPSGQGGVDFLVAVVAADGNGEPANDRVVRGGFSAVWGCDGLVLYRDIDGDGFGNDDETVLRCESEAGWTETGGDCVDFRDTVWPGATEVANGRDDDCNGEVDEGITGALLYPDRDGDGFGSAYATPMEGDIGLEGFTPNGEDCDDANPETHPDATEICDGRDQNCNETLDEGSFEYCGVGRCLVRLELCDHECVPLQPFVERCNGLDDDCDGETDNGDLCPPGEVCDGSCLPTEGVTTTEPSPAASPSPDTVESTEQPPSSLGLDASAPGTPEVEPSPSDTETPSTGDESVKDSPLVSDGGEAAKATPSPANGPDGSSDANTPTARSGCSLASATGPRTALQLSVLFLASLLWIRRSR